MKNTDPESPRSGFGIPNESHLEANSGNKNSESRGFFTRDFFEIFKIYIPIPGILEFSGFFDSAQNKKFRSWILGIGIWDSGSRTNPISKPTLVIKALESALKFGKSRILWNFWLRGISRNFSKIFITKFDKQKNMHSPPNSQQCKIPIQLISALPARFHRITN